MHTASTGSGLGGADVNGRRSKGFWLAAALLLISASSARSQRADDPASRIYTAAQATQGAALFGEQCAACHGAQLEGLAGPALKGELFQQMADAQKLTPRLLMAITAQTMPKGSPNTLARDQYAAITAYILQQNGYVSGQTPFELDGACTECTAPLRAHVAQRAAVAAPSGGAQSAEEHGAAATAPPPTAAGAVPETVLARAHDARVDVTQAEQLAADKNLDDWLLYGRTYDNNRYSPLTEINARNVSALRPASLIQTGFLATFTTSPIVVDGVMYISTPNSTVQAYDAVTGAPLWRYAPRLGYSVVCCGPVNRGVAIAKGKVFVAQLDGRVTALDARNGEIKWRTEAAKTLPGPDTTFYSFTMAPQVYDSMVIVGNSGAEYPTRGFVQAYDQETGKLLWRFHTTAAPDEPGGDGWEGDSWKTGGGSVWSTPAIDHERGLIIFATGNPQADYWPAERRGDNGYTVSIVAIHAKTGKLAWWYQMVPHDQWDYDAAAPVLLFDVDDGKGGKIPVAGEAGKEGHLFMVDRRDGKLVRKSDAFVIESANKFTPLSSTPITILPGVNGGNIWSPPAYSPLTKYFYVPATNQAWTYTSKEIPRYKVGDAMVGQRLGGTAVAVDASVPGGIEPHGVLSAIDVNSGKIAWQYKSALPMVGGALVTGGNLVFHTESSGDIAAFDAKNGKKLWTYHLGAGATAPPITYRVKGKQYVAVAAGGLSGGGVSRAALNKGFQPQGGLLAIFSLPD